MSGNSTNPPTWPTSGDSSIAGTITDSSNWTARAYINGLTFGIAFTLYLNCARALYKQLWHPDKRRQAIFMLIYITVLILCGIVYLVSNACLSELAFVNVKWHRLEESTGFILPTVSSPSSLAGRATYLIISWLTGAILIWRLHVIWSVKEYVLGIVALPWIFYLTSIATSIGHIIQISRQDPSMAFPLGLAFYISTTSLTIIATILMAFRLLVARKQYIEAMGDAPQANGYLGIATMMVESCTLYSIWSIVLIILFGIRHPIQGVFVGSLAHVQNISLLMMVYRVSRGTAWGADTEKYLSTLKCQKMNGEVELDHVVDETIFRHRWDLESRINKAVTTGPNPHTNSVGAKTASVPDLKKDAGP